MITKTFHIPSDNLEGLKAGFLKLTRKANKLGVAPPTLVEVGEEYRPVLDEKNQPTGEMIHFTVVEVSGETPRLAGWTFVATLEGMDGEVMVRAVPGQSLPVRFRNHDTCRNCDHCNVYRPRSETFVVVNDAGEYKQVGRQCLGDFLGGQNPQLLAEAASFLCTAMELAMAAEEGGGLAGGGDYMSMSVFLATTAMVIRKSGWMSKGTAQKLNEANGVFV